MINTTIKFTPSLAKVAKDIQKRVNKLTDFKPLNRKVSTFLFQWVQRNFKTEGRQLADPAWPPLKAGGRWKGKGKNRKFDPNARVLQDTGKLRHSFSPPYYDAKVARVQSSGEREPVAEKHHQGIGVPKRQLVPEKAQVLRDVLAIAKQHADKALKP